MDGLSALLIWSGDAKLFAIVSLSLMVTLSATVLAAGLGLPIGALLALSRFPGRHALIVLVNGAMAAAGRGRPRRVLAAVALRSVG